MKKILLALFVLVSYGCGVEGPRGEKGEKGGDWARENIYCNSSSYPDRSFGKQFEIIADCGSRDFPLSASCYVSNSSTLRVLGGEHVNWESGGLSPRYDCAFEWVGEPPGPYPIEVEAKTEICCVRNSD